MKTRILFVDDEPMVLAGLQRMLRHMRDEWEMTFVNSGEEALALMGERPFDVLLSDMRMPGMNGAQLLCEAMKRHPRTVRFILSGYADKELTMQCAAAAHQFLAKPCDLETLKSAITRALALEGWLNDEPVRQSVSQIAVLPTLPTIYAELIERLQAIDTPLDTIGQIIGRDMAMTAKVLQLVNSAFFGLRYRVANPTEAVAVLGLETVKALVLWIQVFSQFRGHSLREFSLDRLSEHSLATGMLAREIMVSLKADQSTCEEAFTAGLLHDVGKLVFASNQPQKYREALNTAKQSSIPVWQAERHVFGVSHGEVGAYLLGLWGLPLGIVEAAALHHAPVVAGARQVSALTAVHVADALEHEFSGTNPDGTIQVDTDHLAAIGIADRIFAWRENLRDLVPSKREEART
jgi:putative nucleotidyltransferase with HDIG domain